MYSARLETTGWKCAIVGGENYGIEHDIHSFREAFNSDEAKQFSKLMQKYVK